MTATFQQDGSLVIAGGASSGGKEFYYTLGEGNLSIDSTDYAPYVTHQDNVLDLGPGITPDMIDASPLGSGLQLRLSDGSEIDLLHQLSAFAPQSLTPTTYDIMSVSWTGVNTAYNGVQTVRFSDGTEWNVGTETGSATDTNLVGLSDDTAYNPAGFAHTVTGFGEGNIVDFGLGYGSVSVDMEGGTSTIAFGAGISLSDLTFTLQTNNQVVISLSNGIDQLTLASVYDFTNMTFADGTSVSSDGLDFDIEDGIGTLPTYEDSYTYALTPGHTIEGGSESNLFEMTTGSCAIGSGTSNTFDVPSGVGSVTIVPSATGSNIIQLGIGFNQGDLSYMADDATGNLTITDATTGDTILVKGNFYTDTDGQFHSRTEWLQFSDGTVQDTNDLTFSIASGLGGVMSGSAYGDNDFQVSSGIDEVVGAGSGNTYEVSAGLGSLYIEADGGNDVIRLLGMHATDVSYSADASGDLTILDTATGDSVVIPDALSLNAQGYTIADFNHIEFPLDESYVYPSSLTFDVYSIDGVVTATPFGDSVLHVASTDTAAMGGTHDDIFDVAPGTQVLTGGMGYNIYHLQGGQTTIVPEGMGRLFLDGVATAGDAVYGSDAAGDLTITDMLTGSSVTVEADLSVMGNGTVVSKLDIAFFADGTTAGLDDLTFTRHDGQDGSADAVTPSAFGSNILLLSPIDVSASGGEIGSSTFVDAPGIHTITGGAGDNTYHFDEGDGQLTIQPGSLNNELDLGVGITLGMVTYQADDATNTLTISIADATDDTIILLDHFYQTGSGAVLGHTELSFSDGEGSSLSSGLGFTWTGSASMVGSSHGSNLFEVPSCGAAIQLGSGIDTILYGQGDGNVVVTAHGGGATLDFGPGIVASQVSLTSDASGDLMVTVAGSGSITVAGDLAVQPGGVVTSAISEVEFQGGATFQLSNHPGSVPPTYSYAVASESTFLAPSYGDDLLDMSHTTHASVTSGLDQATYLVGPATGADTITPHSGDVVSFGAGATAANVTYSVDAAGDVTLGLTGTGLQLAIVGDLLFNATTGVVTSKAALTFADGSTLTIGTQSSGAQLSFSETLGGGQNLLASNWGNNAIAFAPGGASVIGGRLQNAYTFGLGDGAVTITPGGADTLTFGPGITSSSLAFSSDTAGDLVITVGGNGDFVTILGDLSGSVSSLASRIPQLVFSNGSTLAITSALSYGKSVSQGTTTTGTSSGTTTFQFGPGGGKAISGGGSSIYLFGTGDGASVIANPVGGTLKFGLGLSASNLAYTTDTAGDLTISIVGSSDSLTIDKELTLNPAGTAVTAVIGSLSFANGGALSITSSLVYNETVSGGATVAADPYGSNSFQFGAGGGIATGGYFQNTYLFGSGDGGSVISNPVNGTLKFGVGLSASNLAYTTDSTGDLTISIVGSSDSLTIDKELSLNQSGTAVTATIGSLSFASGGALSITSNIVYNETVLGGATVNADPYGSNGFQFGAGGGTAVGGYFQSTYTFGSGDGHCVISNPVNGILKFGPGLSASNLVYTTDTTGDLTIGIVGSSDSLTIDKELSLNQAGTAVTATIGSLTFASGGGLSITSNLVYDEMVFGGVTVVADSYGQNSFQFGPGGGTAEGGNFASSYLFGSGDGACILSNPVGGTLKFGTGLSASNLAYTADSSGDLTISVVGTSDSLTIDKELTLSQSGTTVTATIGSLSFASGGGLSITSNLVYGHSVAGGATVNADPYGGNSFQFGAGGGTAIGGNFPSSYLFGSGDGACTISNPLSGSVTLGPGLTASSLVFTSDAAGDLTIGLAGSSDSLTIDKELSTSGGTVHSAIGSLTLTGAGSEAINQNLTYTDQVSGGASVAVSAFGANNVQFGAGGGTVNGGAYGNTYNYGEGDGNVQITPATLGTLKFGAGITSQDLWFDHSGSNLKITVMDGQNDTVTVDNWFASTPQTLQEIFGADSLKLDSGMNNLVTAMANYETQNPGFVPLGSTSMPTNSTLHSAITAAWHS